MNKGGLILTKKEMTRLWVDDKFVPVTLLSLIPQEIIRYKTIENDGYLAAVVGAGKTIFSNKEKGIKESYSYITEFKVGDDFVSSHKSGTRLDLSLLEGVSAVELKAISKGKGFQGVVRRYGFAGGRATHGSKFHREPGSIGNRKPRRTPKGQKLPGHMGLDLVTIKDVKIIDIFSQDDLNLVAVKGSVPGTYNGFVKMILN